MNESTPNVWTKGFLPDGRQVSITATPGCDVPALVALALELSAAMTAANITVNLPGLEPGENKEMIVTVMRREKPADGTPIIDFYPAWSTGGGDEPFGTYKYLHIYLNLDNPQLTADFLAASGFKSLNDIPLYDGQSPLKRTKGRVHPKETAVPTPFFVVKKQGDEKIGSDGQPYRPWEFVRYENGGTSQPQRPAAPATGFPIPENPAPSANGGNHDEKPATSKSAAPVKPVVTNETKSEALSHVTAEEYMGKGNKKGIRFVTSTGSYSYTREPFRAAGLDTAQWTKVGSYTFDGPFNVISVWHQPEDPKAQGYWKIDRLEPMTAGNSGTMGAAEREIFGELPVIEGAF